MTELFIKDQSRDDHLAKHGAGDIDMVISPRDGTLVVVAQVDGVHVCARCHEQFVNDVSHRLRAVEYNPGGFGTRIMLHAVCVNPVKSFRSRDGGNFLSTVVRAHQARRFATRATKGLIPTEPTDPTE